MIYIPFLALEVSILHRKILIAGFLHNVVLCTFYLLLTGLFCFYCTALFLTVTMVNLLTKKEQSWVMS